MVMSESSEHSSAQGGYKSFHPNKLTLISDVDININIPDKRITLELDYERDLSAAAHLLHAIGAQVDVLHQSSPGLQPTAGDNEAILYLGDPFDFPTTQSLVVYSGIELPYASVPLTVEYAPNRNQLSWADPQVLCGHPDSAASPPASTVVESLLPPSPILLSTPSSSPPSSDVVS
jgi:hypothetical protein